MNFRTILVAVTLLGLWLGHPLPAMAHRVDEYLQVTRIAVDHDRVSLEIQLTPGVEVAPLVFSWVDTNHDGRISPFEGEAYAQEVMRSLELSIDGKPAPVTLIAKQFPDFREMSEGVGTIYLRARSTAVAVADGRHRVFYRNAHRPEWSVYLANALMPDDPRIEIIDQSRDREQRSLAVGYRKVPGAPPAPSAASVGIIVVLALAGLVGVAILPAKHRRREI